MIARLTGTVAQKTNGHLILDVHEVGYDIRCSKRDWQQLEVGQRHILFIHTHVKEDALDLYGFSSSSDLQIFKLLITVSGVGPKLALTILGIHPADEIGDAISKADTDFFQTISGIGKKNAQKIIVELKPKFGHLKELELQEELEGREELLAALQSLGYKISEVKPWLAKLPAEISTIEDQVRWLLKQLQR